MQRMFLRILAIGLLSYLAGLGLPGLSSKAYAQSLGEIARENKEKQAAQEPSAAKPAVINNQSLAEIAAQNQQTQNQQTPDTQDASAPKKKVITNADLGEGPEGRPDLEVQQRTRAMARSGDYRPMQQGDHNFSEQRGGQWRRQIAEQENRVANLQARLDRINESLRSSGNAQGAYSRFQAIQAERAAQVQTQLDEQKTRLDVMQDAARRAGMNNPY